MTLGDIIHGRDNNFNLIRVVAATAVLITHSFVLTTGASDSEPLRLTYGVTLGTIAVDIFFITSGFLVTASLLQRKDVLEFILARSLRIYPALIVIIILSVFLLGPSMTSYTLQEYFASPKLLIYILQCLTLVFGVAFELPGVFQSNPYANVVNGSLWTLPYEVQMYLVLASAWVVSKLAQKKQSLIFCVLVFGLCIFSCIYIFSRYFLFIDQPGYNFINDMRFTRLLFMFFTGCSFYILRNKVKIDGKVFFCISIALTFASLNRHAFFVVYTLGISYIVFFVAYKPNGIIRKYNSFGDYSYGIYIYAFPIQQCIVHTLPNLSIFRMVYISLPITALFAAVSWHLIERRTLQLKVTYALHIRKIVGTTKAVQR